MLAASLRLEFGWGEVAQRGMDPLVHIHVVQEAADVVICIMIVEILGQVNFLFFDGPDDVIFCRAKSRTRLCQGTASRNPSWPRECLEQ